MNNCLWILFVAITVSLQAQSAFRIKVIDADNSNPIEKALVYIEEIPLPDQETDINGFVTFKNVPEDRKVKLNIRKKGYVPFQDEIVANRTLTVDNYKIIKLNKESNAPQVIIYGEVSDKKGDEVEGANVEVTILGKPFTAITDKSGNYQIKIDGSVLKSVPTFQIEAKKTGCERYKGTESVPKSEIINKDIVLQCSENKVGGNIDPVNPKPTPITTLKNDKLYFELVECKQNGQTVRIEFQVKSENEDVDLTVYGETYSRIIDGSSGKEFNPEDITIADKSGNVGWGGAMKTLVAGYPVKMIIEFGKVTPAIKIISKLEMLINQGSDDVKIEFRNIPVK